MNIYIYPHIRIIAYGAKRMGKGNEDKRQQINKKEGKNKQTLGTVSMFPFSVAANAEMI